MTSASCTLDTTTQTSAGATSASCYIPQPVIGGGYVSANATATDALSGGVATVNVTTQAGATPGLTASAAAQASDAVSYRSTGSARSGFMDATIAIGFLHYDSPEAGMVQISDGTHQYYFDPFTTYMNPGDCGPEDCYVMRTLPIDLGATFQVSASSSVGIDTACSQGCPNGQGSISFSLVEADGTTAVPFSAVSSVTPEPASLGFLAFGVAALALLRNRKSFVKR